MNTERTFRRGFKWAKLTHAARGKWVVAFGWNGEVKATRVQWGSKVWAQIAIENYLNDQP